VKLTDDIVKQYCKLVRHVASQYARSGVDPEDLEQSAWDNLAQRLAVYDGRVPLGAYVAIHIRWGVLYELERQGIPVRKRDTVKIVALLDSWDDDKPPKHAEPSHDPTQANEDEIDVRSLLASLPEDERSDFIRLVLTGDDTTAGKSRRNKTAAKLREIAREKV